MMLDTIAINQVPPNRPDVLPALAIPLQVLAFGLTLLSFM